MNNNNRAVLKYPDLLSIKDIIINRFNIEMEKISLIEFAEQESKGITDNNSNNFKSLSNSFLEIYLSTNAISVYSSKYIDYITTQLAKSNVMTETILNISHCVSIELSVEELSIDKIYNTLIEGSSLVRLDPTDDSNQCSLSKNILSTYYVDSKVVKEILKSNFYLIVLNFIISYFHETDIYKNILTDNEQWNQSKKKVT